MSVQSDRQYKQWTKHGKLAGSRVPGLLQDQERSLLPTRISLCTRWVSSLDSSYSGHSWWFESYDGFNPIFLDPFLYSFREKLYGVWFSHVRWNYWNIFLQILYKIPSWQNARETERTRWTNFSNIQIIVPWFNLLIYAHSYPLHFYSIEIYALGDFCSTISKRW